MSKLLEKISHDQLQARRARDKFKASALTTLLGEASPKGLETVSDESVEKVVQKFVKNLRETANHVAGNPEKLEVVEAELAIFEEYLPKQLTEQELRYIVSSYISYHGCETVGDIMKFLKMEYPGQYDGKLASSIAKEILGS